MHLALGPYPFHYRGGNRFDISPSPDSPMARRSATTTPRAADMAASVEAVAAQQPLSEVESLSDPSDEARLHAKLLLAQQADAQRMEEKLRRRASGGGLPEGISRRISGAEWARRQTEEALASAPASNSTDNAPTQPGIMMQDEDIVLLTTYDGPPVVAVDVDPEEPSSPSAPAMSPRSSSKKAVQWAHDVEDFHDDEEERAVEHEQATMGQPAESVPLDAAQQQESDDEEVVPRFTRQSTSHISAEPYRPSPPPKIDDDRVMRLIVRIQHRFLALKVRAQEKLRRKVVMQQLLTERALRDKLRTGGGTAASRPKRISPAEWIANQAKEEEERMARFTVQPMYQTYTTFTSHVTQENLTPGSSSGTSDDSAVEGGLFDFRTMRLVTRVRRQFRLLKVRAQGRLRLQLQSARRIADRALADKLDRRASRAPPMVHQAMEWNSQSQVEHEQLNELKSTTPPPPPPTTITTIPEDAETEIAFESEPETQQPEPDQEQLLDEESIPESEPEPESIQEPEVSSEVSAEPAPAPEPTPEEATPVPPVAQPPPPPTLRDCAVQTQAEEEDTPAPSLAVQQPPVDPQPQPLPTQLPTPPLVEPTPELIVDAGTETEWQYHAVDEAGNEFVLQAVPIADHQRQAQQQQQVHSTPASSSYSYHLPSPPRATPPPVPSSPSSTLSPTSPRHPRFVSIRAVERPRSGISPRTARVHMVNGFEAASSAANSPSPPPPPISPSQHHVPVQHPHYAHLTAAAGSPPHPYAYGPPHHAYPMPPPPHGHYYPPMPHYPYAPMPYPHAVPYGYPPPSPYPYAAYPYSPYPPPPPPPQPSQPLASPYAYPTPHALAFSDTDSLAAGEDESLDYEEVDPVESDADACAEEYIRGAHQQLRTPPPAKAKRHHAASTIATMPTPTQPTPPMMRHQAQHGPISPRQAQLASPASQPRRTPRPSSATGPAPARISSTYGHVLGNSVLVASDTASDASFEVAPALVISSPSQQAPRSPTAELLRQKRLRRDYLRWAQRQARTNETTTTPTRRSASATPSKANTRPSTRALPPPEDRPLAIATVTNAIAPAAPAESEEEYAEDFEDVSDAVQLAASSEPNAAVASSVAPPLRAPTAAWAEEKDASSVRHHAPPPRSTLRSTPKIDDGDLSLDLYQPLHFATTPDRSEPFRRR